MTGSRLIGVGLGLGSLGFAAWGLVAPGSVASAVNISPGAARAIGWRDLALGAALLARPGPAPLVARAAADVADAALFARRRPVVAVVAVASAATASLAAARAGRVAARG